LLNILIYELKKVFSSRAARIFFLISVCLGIGYSFFDMDNPNIVNKESSASLLISKSSDSSDINIAREKLSDRSHWSDFSKISSRWYLEKGQKQDIPPKYFAFRNYYGLLDGMYSYFYTASLYNGASKVPEHILNANILDEKSGFQSIFSSTKSKSFQFIYILFILSIFNIFINDKKNYSVNLLLPSSDIKLLFAKYICIILTGFSMFTGFLTAVFISASIRYGFGTLFIDVPIFQTYTQKNGFQVIQNGDWFNTSSLLSTISFSLLCVILVLNVIALLSIFVNQIFPEKRIVFIPSLLLVISSLVPTGRYSLVSEYNKFFPWNYLNTGQLISGELNYWSGNRSLNLANFIFIYSLLILILSTFILVLWRYKHSEKHYQAF